MTTNPQTSSQLPPSRRTPRGNRRWREPEQEVVVLGVAQVILHGYVCKSGNAWGSPMGNSVGQRRAWGQSRVGRGGREQRRRLLGGAMWESSPTWEPCQLPAKGYSPAAPRAHQRRVGSCHASKARGRQRERSRYRRRRAASFAPRSSAACFDLNPPKGKAPHEADGCQGWGGRGRGSACMWGKGGVGRGEVGGGGGCWHRSLLVVWINMREMRLSLCLLSAPARGWVTALFGEPCQGGLGSRSPGGCGVHGRPSAPGAGEMKTCFVPCSWHLPSSALSPSAPLPSPPGLPFYHRRTHVLAAATKRPQIRPKTHKPPSICPVGGGCCHAALMADASLSAFFPFSSFFLPFFCTECEAG